MRDYAELLASDPAWPEIEGIATATGRATILPPDPAAARACLESLQVTTRSPLGAFAHETGGILVDHGWIRMLGSGHARLTRTLGHWNAALDIPLSELLIIADDVVGGVFAINGGAFGTATRGHVFYFAPDSLGWEDTELGHGDWVGWIFDGDLAQFYENVRWPGWEQEVAKIGGDQALSLFPFPWTKEGQDLSKVARKAVPVREVWDFQVSAQQQLS